MRIYSGTVTSGSYVTNTIKDSKERVGRLMLMHANKREDVESASAGEIVAIGGMKNITTGDTISDENKPIILESMEFPDPVVRVAVEPKTRAGPGQNGHRAQPSCSGRSVVPGLRPTTKPARRSSPEWANFTLRSSSIA